MATRLKQLMEQARHEHWALGAFNAANIETIQAIYRAAQKLEAPVIIESSPGETEYIGARALHALIAAYNDQYGVQAFLNLDHAVDVDAALDAMSAEYDLIHFDGAELSYEANVRATKQVVQAGHRHRLLIEGELDHIAGSSNVHTTSASGITNQAQYTDPERAKAFVQATGIDLFAVAIGNLHGVYPDTPALDSERLGLIRAQLGCYLTLHGGSGIPDAEIKQAIAGGITKVNVNTELRMAFLTALKQAVQAPKEIAAYKVLPPVIDAVEAVVAKKITLFGSVGKAKRVWVKRIIA